MKVTLKNYTPLWVCSDAIRTCWDSHDKSDTDFIFEGILIPKSEAINLNQSTFVTGPKDKELIDRVGNKNKHASTLEHLYYNFQIQGVSRALLQELARHRMASLSVKSTRYTLKELKNEACLYNTNIDSVDWHWSLVEKYCVLTGNTIVDEAIANALNKLKDALEEGISNDIAKYCLPEAYKTELAWSINARSLQNFLSLRSSPSSLWEIRNLANAIFEALPEDHKYLFEESLYVKN